MSATTSIVYFSLGSNLENRLENIQLAIRLLVENGLKMLQVSQIYQTVAWGKTDQTDFLNCCLQMETNLTPIKLLQLTQNIEKKVGRVKREHWHEREIDIDIIYYGDHIICTPELQIPHPYMIVRNFVLNPLAEIAANKLHPIFQLTTKQLLHLCIDEQQVNLYKEK